jgi:hypothetical protein
VTLGSQLGTLGSADEPSRVGLGRCRAGRDRFDCSTRPQNGIFYSRLQVMSSIYIYMIVCVHVIVHMTLKFFASIPRCVVLSTIIM